MNNFLMDDDDQNQEEREQEEDSENEEEGFQNSDKRNIENVIKSKKDFLANMKRMKQDVDQLTLKKNGSKGNNKNSAAGKDKTKKSKE